MMSSLPGYTQESFLAWYFNLIIDGDGSANFSLTIAETLGTIFSRPNLSTEQFSSLVLLFETYRESIEIALDSFEPENQSWRDYAIYAFDFIPDSLYEQGLMLIKGSVE